MSTKTKNIISWVSIGLIFATIIPILFSISTANFSMIHLLSRNFVLVFSWLVILFVLANMDASKKLASKFLDLFFVTNKKA
jgi:hypothetical protein